MKIRKIKENEKGQVLGLPMYLIIIMIVAVAVIAAVIFMLPQGTKTIKYTIDENSVVLGNAPDTSGVSNFNSFTVKVYVFSADERGDPIYGAKVRLSGGGVIGEDSTDANGLAEVPISGAKLNPGISEASMKLTIKASGFEDFTDDDAVLLYKPT